MKFLLSITLTLVSLLLPVHQLSSMNLPGGAPGMPAGMPFAGAPEPGSFDEFFLNTIAGMSEQELEELAKLGEQIAKDMEAAGINVDDFLKEQLGEFPAQAPSMPKAAAEKIAVEAEPTMPEPEITAQKAEEVSGPLIPLDSEKKEQIDYILMAISEKIPELIRQSNNNAQYQDQLAPFVPDLITVNYFVRLLHQEKYLKYIGQENFAQLLANLKRLGSTLEQQEPLLFIPQEDLDSDDAFARLRVPKSASDQEIEKAYKKIVRTKNPARIQSDLEESGASAEKIKAEVAKAQKEFDKIETAYYTTQRIAKSHAAFKTILYTVSATCEPIIRDIQKLLKLYDPEALKIKEQQEKRAAEAKSLSLEASKKEAPQAPYVFDRAAFGYGNVIKEEPYMPHTPPSYQPSQMPQQESARLATGPSAPGGGKGAPSKEGAPSKGGEEKGKKPETPQEKKAKEKEEKAKEEAVKKKKEEKDQSLNMKIKLGQRKDMLERIAQYLDETPPTGQATRHKLFSDFTTYLATDDIIFPYTGQSSMTAFNKALEINQTISYVTQSLQVLTSDISRDMSTIPSKLKADYKKELAAAFKKFQDDYAKKKLSKLLGLKVDPVKKEVTIASDPKFNAQKISLEKKYAHFGFDEFGPSATQPGKSIVYDQDHEQIRMLNPQTVCFVGDIIDVYKKLADLITKDAPKK